MSTREFTPAEMEQLMSSPYVLDITPNTIHFSVEFKKKFWELIQENKPPREIIIELGLDPDMLGKSRISGLQGMIKKDGRAGNGFRDLKSYGAYLREYACADYKIKYLEQQLAYKDQEIEFLKKIVSLGQEGKES